MSITFALVVFAVLLGAILYLPVVMGKQKQRLMAATRRNLELLTVLRNIWDETSDKRDVSPVADYVAGEVQRVMMKGELQ